LPRDRRTAQEWFRAAASAGTVTPVDARAIPGKRRSREAGAGGGPQWLERAVAQGILDAQAESCRTRSTCAVIKRPTLPSLDGW